MAHRVYSPSGCTFTHTMAEINFEFSFISQRSPCLSLPSLAEKKKKKKSIWQLIFGQVGHGSVRRCSHIMMFDQGKSRFSYGVNELMRMTLTQSPFCLSEANPSLLCRCLGCRASAFILLHRHGSSRLFIYSVLMQAVSLHVPCKAH